MKVLFAASPAIAVPALEALSREEGIELAGVLTNPDSPKGRHGTPFPTETGEAADKINRRLEEQGKRTFPVFKPVKLDALAREQIARVNPDLLVSFAYGHIFGPKFLALFPLGGVNIHPSLLPKYRGSTPVQAAILNRDKVTGISIQRLAQEMDSGDILSVEQLQLTGMETAASLSAVVSEKSALMLPEVLGNITAGKAVGIRQDESQASYCPLIKKDDGIIDWKTGAAEIEARIRAFDPWPLCSTFHNKRQLFILKAGVCEKEDGKSNSCKPGFVMGIDKQAGILVQTGEGILAVTELQYQAKKALCFQDFHNGARDFTGSILG
jgi:methionyl-tRNA formyltransferase